MLILGGYRCGSGKWLSRGFARVGRSAPRKRPPNPKPHHKKGPKRPHKHKDPTRHDFSFPPCIGPWNQTVRSLCLYSTIPYSTSPYYNLLCYYIPYYIPYILGSAPSSLALKFVFAVQAKRKGSRVWHGDAACEPGSTLLVRGL